MISHRKKPPTMKTDMTSGAGTFADAHPDEDPEMTAKMNNIKAAECESVLRECIIRRAQVRIDTPNTSRISRLVSMIGAIIVAF